MVWTSTSAMQVLKDHYPQVEVLPAHLRPTDKHTFGLVALASLTAMWARVKELEEALRSMVAIVENGNIAEWDEFEEVEIARTALKGGSNG